VEKTEEPRPWTTIDRFFHPTEAHIAAGRLMAEGIPVNLLGINHVSANWLLANALGGIHLQVPLQYVDVSRDILSSAATVEEPDSEKCPKCGSRDTTSHTTAWKLSLLAIHLFNFPLPLRKGGRRCEECCAAWTEH
jgi:hypothetical protein